MECETDIGFMKNGHFLSIFLIRADFLHPLFLIKYFTLFNLFFLFFYKVVFGFFDSLQT